MADYILEQVEQTYSDLNGESLPAGDWPSAGSWTFSEEGQYAFKFDQASAAAIAAVPGIIGWRIDVHLQAAPEIGETVRLYWQFAFDAIGGGSYSGYGPSDDSPGSYFDFTAPGGQDYTIVMGAPYIGPTLTVYEILERAASTADGGYRHGNGTLEGSYLNTPGVFAGLTRFDVVFFTAATAIRGYPRQRSGYPGRKTQRGYPRQP